MTIQEMINYVDDIKPNAFSGMQKTMWLNEVEGMVQTDVMLLAPPSIVTYVYAAEWKGNVSFPDTATMVCASVPGFRAGGMVTISELVEAAANNVTAKILDVSSDGLTLIFAEGTFTASPEEAATLNFDGSQAQMLIPAPHHKIYYTYLLAMIDFANGEYSKYQNTMTLFNSFLSSFTKWYAEKFQPADGMCLARGYYLSAYAIAVKHGFIGTEEDFLCSLKGERGEAGNSIDSLEKSDGTGAPGTTDTYTITMTDGNTDSFTVYNGSDGNFVFIDSVLSSLSTNPVQNNVVKASLDAKADLEEGLIPASQLPSYVDDVVEAGDYDTLPGTGISGKIYVTLDDNRTYRWSGSDYVEISKSLALGETAATAYRGDRGAMAYAHSQTTGNPHSLTKSDIGLAQVDNTSDTDKPISTAVQSAIDVKQDAIDNLAYRLFYGSGAAGALTQLSFPLTAGSILRQNTEGAPYWTTVADLVTAMKSGLVNTIYPVGSIYISVSSTSPATLFGGTWSQLQDRFLLGAGSTYTNGATGGESAHTLTTAEMPSHTHNTSSRIVNGNNEGGTTFSTPYGSTYNFGYGQQYATTSAGSGGAHNNMPPYLVIYMWKRTA